MKKESNLKRLEAEVDKVFLVKKYYPKGGDFFIKNPKGLTLQSESGKP